ncbi:MAG TPA: biotin-dependent carboxyltransferase family protein [Phycisphaerae bacterium]|nr:biotin-dependent carboxyltransferase family protein [Phycisphaerae bacterium]
MSKPAVIRVIDPGMLTTVQDLGRVGWSGIGVGRGGAADTLSLRVGNRLVGNDDGAAAFEMTLVGGTFEFERDATIVLSGGAVTAQIIGRRDKRPAAEWKPFKIRSGEKLVTGPIRSGVRSYLCVSGGIDVPQRLGSRSTHLVGAFGGLKGRALRSGDLLEVGGETGRIGDSHLAAAARAYCESRLSRRSVRAVDGPHLNTFDFQAIERLWTTSFKVSVQSDRTGMRLKGRLGPSTLGGRMPSEGMMPGAVQVPASGEPIVLMVDYPTTGGYPVIACVAAVDLPVLGQVRPRQTLRFERVSLAESRSLFAEQEQSLNAEVPPP